MSQAHSLRMKSDQTAPRRKMSPPNRARAIDTEKEKKQRRRPPPAPKAFFCLLSSAESIIDCFDKGRGEPVQFNEKGRVFRGSRDCLPLFLFLNTVSVVHVRTLCIWVLLLPIFVGQQNYEKSIRPARFMCNYCTLLFATSIFATISAL